MSLAIESLFQPPVLFFAAGLIAALVKSDLEPPGMKLLVTYLLVAIGLHGGVELRSMQPDATALGLLAAAMVFAAVTPFLVHFITRKFLAAADAAAISASYGSVSAVTFLAAMAHLESQGQTYSGFMVAALALMEWPAILVGVFLAHRAGLAKEFTTRQAWSKCLTCSSVFLLLASLAIGWAVGERGWAKLETVYGAPLTGVLCLFLLGLGVEAGRKLHSLPAGCGKLWAFALIFPPCMALLGGSVAWIIGAAPGDALLLTVLCASASYIAAPAAMRLAVPEANTGLYLMAPLALTFPFNVLVGIPLFSAGIRHLW